MLAPCVAAERQEEYSGVEDNVPFRCNKSRAETAAFTTAQHTVAAVMPSSQHPSSRAVVESIQLIYSGRALESLSDALGNFSVNPSFGGRVFMNLI
jgi:hypothetical protein